MYKANKLVRMKGKAEGFIALIYLRYQLKTFLSWVAVGVALTFSIHVIVWISNQALYHGAVHVCALSSSNGVLHKSTGQHLNCQLNFFLNKVFSKINLSGCLCCLLLQKAGELVRMLQCSKCTTTD